MAFGAGHAAGAAEVWGKINGGVFWQVEMPAAVATIFSSFGLDFETKTHANN